MLRWSIVMLLVLAGCGGGGDEVTAPATGATATTRRIDRPSGAPDGPFAPTAPPRPVERPSGGPDGPIFPPGTPAYRMLSEGRCQELLTEIDGEWQKDGNVVVTDAAAFYLYRSAAQACLGQWDGALQDFEKLTAEKPTFTGTCADAQECEPCKAAVLKWLTEQINARRRDRAFTPNYVKGTGKAPCPNSSTTTEASAVTSTTRRTTTSRQTTTTA